MSYARWGRDGSDVYVYQHIKGPMVCCGCLLAREPDAPTPWPDFHATTVADMLEHLAQHRDAGHRVPRFVDDRLKEERAEIEAFIREAAGDE